MTISPNLGINRLTPIGGSQTGSDGNNSSKEDSTLCDGPVTESTTEGDGQDFPDPNKTQYWVNVNRRATGETGDVGNDRK